MIRNDWSIIETILEAVGDPMMVVDTDGRIRLVNTAFEKVTGYRAEEAVGNTPRLLDSGRHSEAFWSGMWQALETEGTWNAKVWNRLKNGEVHRFGLSIKVHGGDDGNIAYFIGRLHDDMANDTESNAAIPNHYDDLTGLPNRDLFKDRLEQAVMAAQRAKTNVACLSLGLDRFNLINEGIGREAGDDLLERIAVRFSDCVRDSDTVARIEGDRFGMILQVSNIDDGVIVAEKAIKSLRDTFDIAGQEVSLTTSIGLSLYPEDAMDAEQLARNSDSAMRYAKRQGGNQYQFYANDLNVKARKRIELEDELRKAIQNEEFTIYYQPKVATETGHVVGAEALVRWISPHRGFVGPGDFIPVAEETGLIEEIGAWVMIEAARQNQQWQDQGYTPLRMSVNVSAQQFRGSQLLDVMQEALETSGLSPKWLELEITESMLMGNAEKTIEVLEQVRAAGVHLSIDDFGTGYSSLSYLTRFPLTTLKIDRAFVNGLESDPNKAEIARAIIGMSQGLSLEVVAEGAENPAHIDFLKQNGCDMVQGFYYSKPLPVPEFEVYLKKDGQGPVDQPAG